MAQKRSKISHMLPSISFPSLDETHEYTLHATHVNYSTELTHRLSPLQYVRLLKSFFFK